MHLSESFLPEGLTYRYGVVGAGKTAALLKYYFELRSSCGRVLLAKPGIDTRHGTLIQSRNGAAHPPDFLIEPEHSLRFFEGYACGADALLIDEAQFLSATNVDALRIISHRVPVICFGLRTDFQGHTFAGSLRLWELADRVDAIPGTCKCGKPATFNAHAAGATAPDSQVQIGGDELFRACCYGCWTPRVKA